MSEFALGRGFRIESLDIKPSFPSGVGRATLTIPDPLFPDIKGTIRVSSGMDPTARTVGATAMSATAGFIMRGSNCAVGFKQLAAFRFQTALYAGLKESDGSIDESSTGLNFRLFLDCSPRDDLTTPWAPFYLPPVFVRNGAPVSIDMPDQPGARYRLQRRNSLRDRLNFLISVRSRCEFVTFVVVQLPDGTHAPTEGFSWRYNHEVDLNWQNGTPSIARDTSHIGLDSRLPSLPAGDPRFGMLANARLGSTDTIVFKFNQAMRAAASGAATSDYEIREFAGYSDNVAATMKGRFNNQFF